MGDDYAKLQAGMRIPGIPAGVWNDMLDAIAWVKAQKARTGVGRGQAWQNTGIVQVKNITGAALDRFAVVGIASEVFPTPTNNLAAFKNVPYLYGETPDASKHAGSFAVLQAPLGINKIGPAVVSGVTVCRLAIGGLVGQYADIINGDSDSLGLISSGSARVLWADDSETDPVWAVVRIGGGGDRVVKIVLTEDLGETTAGEASCTISSVWSAATESYSGSDAGVAKDTTGMFAGALDGATGWGWLKTGNSRQIVEIGNLDCGS